MSSSRAALLQRARTGVRAAVPALRRAQVAVARPVLERQAQRLDEPSPSRWGLEGDSSAGFSLNGVSTSALMAEFGSPVHVVDLDRLRELLESSARACEASPSPLTLMAAHRSTHVNAVVADVARAGWSLWSASRYERRAAVDAGMSADRIIHAPRVLGVDDAAEAIAAGVGTVCAGTADEFVALVDAAGNAAEARLGVTIELSASSDVEWSAAALAAMVINGPTHLHIRAAERRMARSELDAFADVVAAVLAAASGAEALVSVSLSVELRPDTVRLVDPVRARLNRSLGVPLALDADDPTDLAAVASGLHARIERASGREFAFAFDPGGFTTASTQFTLATVIDIDEGSTVDHVVLDAGINLADDTLIEHHHLIPVQSARGSGGSAAALRRYRFVGPICTPADVLYANQWVPEVATGDVMAIMDTGGDYVSSSTNFSFPRPAVVGVTRSSGAVELRAGEGFSDLVALDVVGI